MACACGRPLHARGMCRTCYQREYHAGRLKKRTALERFWEKVIETPSGCWEWQGWRDEDGYGSFKDGRGYRSHRWSYEHFVGPIPEGMQIDHLCRNPPCVNPAHLEPVTLAENLARGNTWVNNANSRKTHCKRGHPYDEANTYRAPNGRRFCRACGRLATLEYLARKKAALEVE